MRLKKIIPYILAGTCLTGATINRGAPKLAETTASNLNKELLEIKNISKDSQIMNKIESDLFHNKYVAQRDGVLIANTPIPKENLSKIK